MTQSPPPWMDDGPPVDDPPREQSRGGRRPTIRLQARFDLNELASIAALTDADLYSRGGLLVRVLAPEEQGLPPKIHGLTPAALRPLLSSVADFESFNKTEGWHSVPPPKDLATGLVERGTYPGIRPLAGVSRAPVLRPDGSLVATPGYDVATRLLYAPDGPPPPVLDHPTLDDAVEAITALLAPMDEMPFKADEDASAWLALVLTLCGRSAIEGCCPMWLATANQARIGKTRSIQLAGLIAHGKMTPTTKWSPAEEELAKKIDAFIFAAREFVLWDNIRGPIGSEALELAITSTEHEGRVLGSSDPRYTHNRTVWAASGNGATLKGDMAGRTLPMRLHEECPNPEERTFTIPDLEAHIRTRRPRLLSAALTVLRAYILAGRPDQDLTPWGSFEAWSLLVRSALVWAGQPDPCLTREVVREIDAGASGHERLVELVSALFPSGRDWAASALADRVEARGRRPDETLADPWTVADARDVLAVFGAWDNKEQAVRRAKLGQVLHEVLDRPTAGGGRITRAVDAATGKALVTRTKSPRYVVA